MVSVTIGAPNMPSGGSSDPTAQSHTDAEYARAVEAFEREARKQFRAGTVRDLAYWDAIEILTMRDRGLVCPGGQPAHAGGSPSPGSLAIAAYIGSSRSVVGNVAGLTIDCA